MITTKTDTFRDRIQREADSAKETIRITYKTMIIMDLKRVFWYFKGASGMVVSSFLKRLHQLQFIDKLKRPDWVYELGRCLTERPIPSRGIGLIGLLCFMEVL